MYRTFPLKTAGLPPGISYIIGNEAAERFSFYGMKTILAIFMTSHLLNDVGAPDYMSEGQATVWVHVFVTAVYFTPLLGSFLADAFWGKYKTIICLSIVYCLGHLSLAFDETRTGLVIGLGLIAIGAGESKGAFLPMSVTSSAEKIVVFWGKYMVGFMCPLIWVLLYPQF